MNFKVGDKVVVIAGSDKGKEGLRSQRNWLTKMERN